MEIRTKLSLDTKGFDGPINKSTGAISDLGDAANKANKTVAQGLTQSEKAAVGAAKALQDYRKVQTQIAASSRSGMEQALLMAAGRDPYNKQINEQKKAQREFTNWLKKEEQERQASANAARRPNQQAIFENIVSEDFASKLASTRYALYDVGNRFLAFGLAIETAVAQSVMAAAKFESAFTSVERTSGAAGAELQQLRQSLLDISTTIPVAFQDVTKIATLGAQLGIARSSLDEFSVTVAKFAAITGISVDDVAMSFGRIAELMDVPAEQFENLSSAISFAGVNAVATDTEILRMSESIAAAATQAGFTADQTIGLATALASLKVRPEEARGVIVRLFREIDLSVSEGGQKLRDFSKVLGQTSADAANLWRQNPSQFVQAFLSGAQASGRLNEVITALGITNTRELNVIQRLANNMDVLSSSMKDAEEQFVLGTYASEAYGKVADDLVSKMQVLQNAVDALQAKFGEGFAMALKLVIDPITNLIKGMSTLHPLLFAGVAGFVAIVGALIVFKGAVALSIAGLLALRLAMNNLEMATGGASINLATLRAALQAVTGQAGLAAGAMQFLGVKMNATSVAAMNLQRAMGWIGIALGVLATGFMVFDSIAKSAENAGLATYEAAGGAQAFAAAIKADTDAGEGYRKIAVGVNDLTKAQEESRRAALEAAVAREEAKAAVSGETQALGVAKSALKEFNDEVKAGNEGMATNTQLLGDNTAALLLNSLSKYGEGEGKDFWKQLTELDSGTRSALEAIGFDAAQMVVAGLESEGGAEAYAQKFVDAMQLIAVSGPSGAAGLEEVQRQLADMGIDLAASEIEQLQQKLAKTGMTTGVMVGFLGEAGKELDSTTKRAITTAKSGELLQESLGKVGAEALDAEGYVQTLSEMLVKYGESAIAVGEANVDINDSFASLVQATSKTTGELNSLTTDSRAAMKAWSSFMRESIKSAVAEDTGFAGAVQTMASAIYALGQEGVNTGYQFQQMKNFVVTSLAQTAPAFKAFAGNLATAMDTTAMVKMIDAMAATISMSAFMGKSGAANAAQFAQIMAIRDALVAGSKGAGDFKSVYEDAMNSMQKSTGKSVTALDRLIAKIDAALKFTRLYTNMRASLFELGAAFLENGKGFSSFTEAGRNNISALEAVIGNLAEKSGGDVQKFANDLASLRQALIDIGVDPSQLKIIDDILKGLGKNGKVSASAVESFTNALKSATKEAVKAADAVKKVSERVKQGISNSYAYRNSIYDVALGWLDMSDAAKAAEKRIEDLRKTIEESGNTIDELTAKQGKLEYQLEIALKYGDTLRAAEIEAELAQVRTDIGTATVTRDEAQAEVDQGVTTRQLIEKNRALQDMANRYADLTAWMMITAPAGTDLNEVIKKQVTEFYNAAIAMGYTEEEAKAMATVLNNELTTSIEDIPDTIDIGVNVGVDGAMTLLGKVITKITEVPKSTNTSVNADATDAENGVNDANDAFSTLPATVTTKIEIVTTEAYDKVKYMVGFMNQRLNEILKPQIKVNTESAYNKVKSFVSMVNAQLDLIKSKTITVTTIHQSAGGSALGVVRRAQGGLVTGPGTATSDSIAARLSNGEFVVKAAAVQYYGTDFMNSLNNMSLQSGAMAPVQMTSAGSQTVYLSTEDRQLLRAAIDRPIALYTDNATIARSANEGNSILAQRGIR